MTDIRIIKSLAKTELEEANKDHELFHSPHEAYAVIQEELEEAEEDLKCGYNMLEMIWQCVRADENFESELDRLYNIAGSLAAEAIQVMAMAAKAKESLYLSKIGTHSHIDR